MKALIISREDFEDRKAWSGIPYKMFEALSGVFDGVYRCDALDYPHGPQIALENRVLTALGRSPYWRMRTAQYHARQLEQRMLNIDFDWDAAIVIDTFMALPCLRLDKPLIYISDCTKTQLVELSYPGFDHVTRGDHRRLMTMERLAYQAANGVVFSSEWAKESAVAQYGVPEEKICIAPFGPNIDRIPSREMAIDDGPWRQTENCELLMIGVHWERKGGPLACGILEHLNSMGLKTRLTVCGTTPPEPISSDIRVFPFLDKNDPEDLDRLEQLLREASYLVVPTRADCSPIVFCEAFAYGLPVVSCQVGGVPEIVTHDVNGFVLDRNTPAYTFAKLIFENYQDQRAYLQFRKAAREAYEKTFNWKRWAETILSITHETCSHHDSKRAGSMT